MADYAMTGKKGTGKSKNFVRIARDTYFAEGRTVASNLDIFLEPMFGAQSKQTYIRVPDKPTAFDLLAAGHGNPDSYNEDKNGALGLDELATWFNTRTFADKGRAEILDFLAHGRKLGWDCFYIMQNVIQVDKQLRESFIEHTVRHTRYDKVKIPFVGGIICTLFGKKAGYFPKFHSATTRIGTNPQDLKTDSATFIGKDIEKCYDTRQVFMSDYPHGTHSVLSPWHVTGRYLVQPSAGWFTRFVLALRGKAGPVVPRHPVTRPDAAYARVMALVMLLPVAERIQILAKYQAAAARTRVGDA